MFRKPNTSDEKKPLLKKQNESYNAVAAPDIEMSLLAQKLNADLLEISRKPYRMNIKHDMMEQYAKQHIPQAIENRDADTLGLLLNAGKTTSIDEAVIQNKDGKGFVTPMQSELSKAKPSAKAVQFLLENGAEARIEHIETVIDKKLSDERTSNLIKPLLHKGAKTNGKIIERAMYRSTEKSDDIAAKLVEGLPNDNREYMDEVAIASRISPN